jgi:diguanylate cyclase
VPNIHTTDDTYTQREYGDAFAIAKQALGFVAKFQTPPTPGVYELWYRYAEGGDEELCKTLDYWVNDAGSVSKNQMMQMQQAFLSVTESAIANARISEKLSDELGGLKSIVDDQLVASGEFDSSLSSASANLRPDSNPNEAKACIELAMSCNEEMQGHLNQVTSKLTTSQNHIEDMRANLLESQKLLLIDPVTEVGNRRFFDTMMHQFFGQNRYDDRHCFILIVDLDKFKDVNDTYGHLTGDRVLRYAASSIQKLCKEASVSRYGGDEFVVFLNADHPSQGKALAETICEHFSKTSLKDSENDVTIDRITTSIGVARLRDDDNRESWFSRADKLLYGAKQSGRNQVMSERNFSDANITIDS